MKIGGIRTEQQEPYLDFLKKSVICMF